MFCAIWYHLYNSKTVKNTMEGVLLFHSSQGVFHGYRFTLTSHGIYIALFVVSGSTKNFNIYLFPILFSIGFDPWKSVGLPPH